ncbi:MAG TPA: four helix bundle protein [Terriglobales bacterium]|jgi:four helix bundle protein|nr:four helix bundle protein [Terriglobales bacterium]
MSYSYRDLKAWQKAIELVVHIYELTGPFPKHELYGLTSQMRRAAVSIASNVAEGKGRSSDRDFVHFLTHSRGSVLELETQLIISARLNLISPKQLQEAEKKAQEVGRILNGLIQSLETGKAKALAARGFVDV